MLAAGTSLLAETRPSVRVMSRLLRAHPHELVTEDIQADLVVVGGAPVGFVPRARARHTQRDPTRPVRRSRDITRARNTPISIRAVAVIDRLGGGHTTASRPGDRGPGQHPASGYSRTETGHDQDWRRSSRASGTSCCCTAEWRTWWSSWCRWPGTGWPQRSRRCCFSATTLRGLSCIRLDHRPTSRLSRRWRSRVGRTEHVECRRLVAAQLRAGGSPGAGDRAVAVVRVAAAGSGAELGAAPLRHLGGVSLRPRRTFHGTWSRTCMRPTPSVGGGGAPPVQPAPVPTSGQLPRSAQRRSS